MLISLIEFCGSKKGIAVFYGILFQLLSIYSYAQKEEKVVWNKTNYRKGLTLQSWHGQIFGSIQNINVLEVDLNKRQISMVYDSANNVPTSELGIRTDAIAAVNGGFFDMKNGGSNSYLKVDGISFDQRWMRNNRLNGVLIFSVDNTVEIEPADSTHNNYALFDQYDDVLLVGPILIDNSVRMSLDSTSFFSDRAPRTCLCIANNDIIKLITVDGRNENAAGMSLYELTDLARLLNCIEAINLDGGGSTTMWINSAGIINMPSDNKKFDHAGERPVSNIIAIY